MRYMPRIVHVGCCLYVPEGRAAKRTAKTVDDNAGADLGATMNTFKTAQNAVVYLITSIVYAIAGIVHMIYVCMPVQCRLQATSHS